MPKNKMPDKFERLVRAACKQQDREAGAAYVREYGSSSSLPNAAILALLRRQHRAMVRMVKKRRTQLIKLRNELLPQQGVTTVIVELSDLVERLDQWRR